MNEAGTNPRKSWYVAAGKLPRLLSTVQKPLTTDLSLLQEVSQIPRSERSNSKGLSTSFILHRFMMPEEECAWWDSNPQARRPLLLKQLRIPIPPHAHFDVTYLDTKRAGQAIYLLTLLNMRAHGGSRTHTALRPPDSESGAATITPHAHIR